uniref:Putative secreted protein n=1 Tax=Anopheles darlingi TaxID=43151 RepID=A0A2M4DFG2_ANODA
MIVSMVVHMVVLSMMWMAARRCSCFCDCCCCRCLGCCCCCLVLEKFCNRFCCDEATATAVVVAGTIAPLVVSARSPIMGPSLIVTSVLVTATG